ncbi:FAD-dependent oxidoreductase [Zobellia galactanivorans]|uniref:NAD(P)/FAD-dependent oxidoreductase n=1 Tax=Zobellia TaxID=112040 RepID=UPI0026E2C661|nr:MULTISPECIES: FAD-dependent oxidoreductase [Zobellia]MDO6516063.1 FAD-dependent oxidoreductase [Zobellia uliginosa]MDO6809046.1 FAD-dependent oxidoreductase [Zobellia galactanivorans]
MKLSYWEYKTWLTDIDFTIVGSGIVGLNCALRLRERFPKAKILILEKGFLPQGASTKNAGFACFGSISEVVADLGSHSEQEVIDLVAQRWKGIGLLRKKLGDQSIDFQVNGGHELFLDSADALYLDCAERLPEINKLLQSVYGADAFHLGPNTFGFHKVKEKYITNSFEGQLHTGKMMNGLLRLVQAAGVLQLNSITVEDFSGKASGVHVKTDRFEFVTRKLFIATNGFAAHLLNEEVQPARAQVLITEPIADLHIKGTFHFDEGYYYFRNIDNRILFGGGRNLDLKGEETDRFGCTPRIQERLEMLLKEVILPETPHKVAQRWSGIMGTGLQKKPIVKPISDHVYCGLRLGGMGIAIGSAVGAQLADLTE